MQSSQCHLPTDQEIQQAGFSISSPSATRRPWMNSEFSPPSSSSLSSPSFYSAPPSHSAELNQDFENEFHPASSATSYNGSSMYYELPCHPLAVGYPESSQRTHRGETYNVAAVHNYPTADGEFRSPVAIVAQLRSNQPIPIDPTERLSIDLRVFNEPSSQSLTTQAVVPPNFSHAGALYNAPSPLSTSAPTTRTDSPSSASASASTSSQESDSRCLSMFESFSVSQPPISELDSSATPALLVDKQSPTMITLHYHAGCLQPVNDIESQSLLASFQDRNDSPTESVEGTSYHERSSQSPDSDHHSMLRSPPASPFSPETTEVPQQRRASNDSLSVAGYVAPAPYASSHRLTIDISDSHPTAKGSSSRRLTRKAKMHHCEICHKLFPRPSGLATHMNSHSGARPFPCRVPGCNKRFAVRSNAKRHLRTHGLVPPPEPQSMRSQFTVGFETPMISHVHESRMLHTRLKWVPQSLSTRTNVDFLQSPATSASDDGEDTWDVPVLSMPLSPVVPSRAFHDGRDEYEERDSYANTGAQPYHPSQWRGALPGPAVASRAHTAV